MHYRIIRDASDESEGAKGRQIVPHWFQKGTIVELVETRHGHATLRSVSPVLPHPKLGAYTGIPVVEESIMTQYVSAEWLDDDAELIPESLH